MKAFLATSSLLLLVSAVFAADLKTWSRYQSILDRAPFGPIYSEDDPAFNTPEEAPPEEIPVDEGPKLSDFIKVSAITVYGGTPAAGFTDTTDNKSYYLYQGKSAGDFTLVEVHAATKSILLRKGEQEEEIYVNGQAPDTNATPSMPDTGIRAKPVPPTNSGKGGYLDRQRQRAAAQAKEEERRLREEEGRRKAEERKQMTFEERDRQIRDVNLELIRTGKGPPLPIKLNREDLTKLGEEGFDVAEALQALDEEEAAAQKQPPNVSPEIAARREMAKKRREEAMARRHSEEAQSPQ